MAIPKFTVRDLWASVVASSQKLGIEKVLLRMVARDLVKGVGAVRGFSVDGGTPISAKHLCSPDQGCEGDAEVCLTAFLVEAQANLADGQIMKARSVRLLNDGMCEVALQPVM